MDAGSSGSPTPKDSLGGSLIGSLHRAASVRVGPGGDCPDLAGVCLSRDQLELLIGSAESPNEFDDDDTGDVRLASPVGHAVVGAFVRLKDARTGGYLLAQIERVTSNQTIQVDLVHYSEDRTTDACSNGRATVSEVRAWARRMISASRDFPSVAYVEAKQEAIDEAVRAAAPVRPSPTASRHNAAATPSPVVGKLMRRATLASELREALDGFASEKARGLHPPDGPSPVRASSAPPESPECSPARYHRQFPVGHNLYKTNDQILWAAAVPSTSSGEGSSAGAPLALFGSRRSNHRTRHPRASDIASFSLEFSATGAIECDRDASAKGAMALCAPQLMGGMFWSVCERVWQGGDGTETPPSSCEHLHVPWRLLSGRNPATLGGAMTGLHVPVPPFAASPDGHSPQLLVTTSPDGTQTMHLFFLCPVSAAVVEKDPFLSAAERRALHTDGEGPAGEAVGLAHAVAADARLGHWTLVTAQRPIITGVLRRASDNGLSSIQSPLYHVSASADALSCLWCTAPTPLQHTVTQLRNADVEQRSPGMWGPLGEVSASVLGGASAWRARGIKSISHNTCPNEPTNGLVLVVGEDERHRSSMLFGVLDITS